MFRRCRVCECTDEHGCEEGCYWVEEDLCSSCAVIPDDCCEICGSSMVWEECWNCGGEGEIEVWEEDPLWYDEGDTETCDVCRGRGGHWICLNVENHERILAEEAGPMHLALWHVKDHWRASRLKQTWGKIRIWYFRKTWPIRNGWVMARIRWTFRNFHAYGWSAIWQPVERCEVCRKLWRVLFWNIGDHGKCIPF